MKSGTTLIRADGKYWRVIKQHSNDAPSPRDENSLEHQYLVSTIVCWNKEKYGDKHEFASEKEFLTDLLLKMNRECGFPYSNAFCEHADKLDVGDLLEILTSKPISEKLTILPVYTWDGNSERAIATPNSLNYNPFPGKQRSGWVYATSKDIAKALGKEGKPDTDWLTTEVMDYDDYLTGKVYMVSIDQFNCPVEGATEDEILKLAKENIDNDELFETMYIRDDFRGDGNGENGIDEFILWGVGEYEEID